MTKRIAIITCFALLFVWAVTAQRDRLEAVEIGRENTDLLPRGKEADGIVGDFVLRNNKLHALISGSQPLRRANMKTEYEYVLQGCLFDLDLRSEENDQITAFRPGGLGGELSYVRVAEDGSNGAAVVEAVRTAAKGDGLYIRHEYRIKHDWQYVLITSVYRNESDQIKTVTPAPVWKGLDAVWQVGAIRLGDSVDPFDKRAYAWRFLQAEEPPEEVELPPGEEGLYRIALAVADSPLAAYGIAAALSGPTGRVVGKVVDPAGTPAIRASLLVPVLGKELPHYPDKEGNFSFPMLVGTYTLIFEDIGRDRFTRNFVVRHNKETELDLEVSRASTVRGEIRDAEGNFLPGKVQFIGVGATPTPNFGTDYRAHGGNHQYHTHDGRFTQQTPPGKYLIRITLGPEYNLFEETVEVARGETVEIQATLKRTVDTTGWISTDYHSHSTPSGDNYCNTNDRVISFATEHIEFAPTTEHNRLYDWQPHIDRLGLSQRVRTVVGIELTGRGQHFNSFPLERDPFAQNGGAPVWNFDPRINALVLRNWGTPTRYEGGSRYDSEVNPRIGAPRFGPPDRWVQANHPIVGTVFFDRNEDQVGDGGFVGLEKLVDAAETWSTEILNLSPTYVEPGTDPPVERQNRTFGWLQMLNQGRHVWCVAVSDAHRIFGSAVGGWRTYVPSSADEPSQIDPAEIIRNSKAGRMMITNGPFLEVTTADGLPIGSTLVSPAHIDLKVKVQTPNWLDIDRVQVLVNGRQPEQHNYTRDTDPEMFRDGAVKFDQTLRIHLQQDAHLIVVAVGENSSLEKGWGLAPQSNMRPIAYTNPIYVDIDNNGFQANGDMLGHPFLVTPKQG